MTDTAAIEPVRGSSWRELLYAVALFVAAVAALAMQWPTEGIGPNEWPRIAFFLAFGLFTISIGYAHPTFGYVSFDRVAQVSSILVLGPVHAAWINGLASFIHPWHRLRKSAPPGKVAQAALTNSGLMALMILAGGFVYVALGGPMPLAHLGPRSFAVVLVMLVVMQVINEVGIVVLARMRGQPAWNSLVLFDTVTELIAGLIAVLVAIVWTRMELDVLLLLLAVLAAGMLALKRFAEMRLKLERLVGERTAALHEKTLKLERLALQDTLTGLYNRRYADAFVAREFEQAAGRERTLTVAFADIDHFKQINDGHSHGVGDHVLLRVAQIFAERMRACDLVARYGGEEFLFCMVSMDEPEAAGFCEELRRAIEREHWSAVSPGLAVTISIGLATRRDEADVAALLQQADACLYRAKHLGRNRVVSRSSAARAAPRLARYV